MKPSFIVAFTLNILFKQKQPELVKPQAEMCGARWRYRHRDKRIENKTVTYQTSCADDDRG